MQKSWMLWKHATKQSKHNNKTKHPQKTTKASRQLGWNAKQGETPRTTPLNSQLYSSPWYSPSLYEDISTGCFATYNKSVRWKETTFFKTITALIVTTVRAWDVRRICTWLEVLSLLLGSDWIWTLCGGKLEEKFFSDPFLRHGEDNKNILLVHLHHWLYAAEDDLRAGTKFVDKETRAGARFTISSFDRSCGFGVLFVVIWGVCFCFVCFHFHSWLFDLREEVFARATVVLTRAQLCCFIMQHGTGVCEQQPTSSLLLIALKAESLAHSRSD